MYKKVAAVGLLACLTIAPTSAYASTLAARLFMSSHHHVSGGVNANLISIEEAQNIALGMTGGGVVRQVEIYNRPNGRVVYEVAITNGFAIQEVYIDARTGEVLKFETAGFPGSSIPVNSNVNTGFDTSTSGNVHRGNPVINRALLYFLWDNI